MSSVPPGGLCDYTGVAGTQCTYQITSGTVVRLSANVPSGQPGLFTGGTYIWAWKGGVAAGQATAAKLNLYPIPSNELSANPNLKQNAGY